MDLTAEDYAEARTDYRAWIERSTVIPENHFLIAFAISSCACVFWTTASPWLRISLAIIAIFSFSDYLKRRGMAEGWVGRTRAGLEGVAGVELLQVIENTTS